MRLGRTAIAAAALWAWASVDPLVGHAQESVVIDRVVMVVGDRLITASDVQLEQALAAREPSPVVPLEAARPQTLAFLRDVAIIRGMAGETAVYRPTQAEVRGRLDSLRATWPDRASWEAFLQEHGLTPERLEALIFSRMVVERYVQRNVGLAARSAGEDRDAYVTRFNEWMIQQRLRVPVRILPQIESARDSP